MNNQQMLLYFHVLPPASFCMALDELASHDGVPGTQVSPVGRESWWNVDGELLSNNHLTAEVHRGLVNVFARGIER